jgi:hypothetical protein
MTSRCLPLSLSSALRSVVSSLELVLSLSCTVSLGLVAMLLCSPCGVDEAVEKKDGDVDSTVFVVIDEDDDDEVEAEVDDDDADVDGNNVEGCLCIFLCRPTASALNPFEAAVVGRDRFCRSCAIDGARKGGR